MQINRDNYEAFFLDYAEGNLSADQLAQLELFLSANPDLREELEEFQNLSLDSGLDASFEDKSSLKRSEGDIVITLDNCEDYFIAYHEGDLGDVEKADVDAFLKLNPTQQEVFDQFGIATLEADEAIQFELKASLHQVEAVGPITMSNYTSFFVAHYEGDLDAAAEAGLQQFLADNPNLQAEFESYGKLTLEADTTVVFADKDELYQDEDRGGIIIPLWRAVAVGAAAAAILIFFLVQGFGPDENNPSPQYSYRPYQNSEEAVDIDTSYNVTPFIDDVQVADNGTTDDQRNQNTSTTDGASDTSSIRPPGGQIHGPIEDPNLNLHIAQDTTISVDTTQAITNAPQELIANDTSNNAPASAQQNEAIASNTDNPEYLKPRQVLGNKIKEKLGIKTSTSDDGQEAIAYGNDGTSERKFSFTKGSTTEYDSYQLKVGGISLSRKKRKKAVTK